MVRVGLRRVPLRQGSDESVDEDRSARIGQRPAGKAAPRDGVIRENLDVRVSPIKTDTVQQRVNAGARPLQDLRKPGLGRYERTRDLQPGVPGLRDLED